MMSVLAAEVHPEHVTKLVCCRQRPVHALPALGQKPPLLNGIPELPVKGARAADCWLGGPGGDSSAEGGRRAHSSPLWQYYWWHQSNGLKSRVVLLVPPMTPLMMF